MRLGWPANINFRNICEYDSPVVNQATAHLWAGFAGRLVDWSTGRVVVAHAVFRG